MKTCFTELFQPQGCGIATPSSSSLLIASLIPPAHIVAPLWASRVLGPLGGRFGASWGLFWASWAPLGASWGPLGGLLGPLWDLLGAFWGGGLDFSVLGIPLEPLLGPSWGLLVRLGRHLGRLGGPLGPFRGRLGSLVGRLGAVLGASWAVLERPEAEKARTQKTSKKPMEIHDFGLLGPSSEASWKALGASWRPLGLSWGHVGRLRAIFGRLGALLDRLGGFLGTSWPVLGPCNRTPASLTRPCRDLAGTLPGYFSSGDPQGPPRARELERLFTSYRRS